MTQTPPRPSKPNAQNETHGGVRSFSGYRCMSKALPAAAITMQAPNRIEGAELVVTIRKGTPSLITLLQGAPGLVDLKDAHGLHQAAGLLLH